MQIVNFRDKLMVVMLVEYYVLMLFRCCPKWDKLMAVLMVKYFVLMLSYIILSRTN